MPLEQTVYIVNNSGKIISSGKQLLSIFKEAKASYQEKKAQLKGERAAPAPLKRAQTFAPSRSGAAAHRLEDYYEEEDEEYHTSSSNRKSQPRKLREYEDIHDAPRRRSYDAASDAGSRRSGTHRHKSSKHTSSRSIKGPPPSTTALTAKNLKAASEASNTNPSKVPMSYRSPYAETLPLDQSRMDLTVVGSRSIAPAARSSGALPRSQSEADFRMMKKYKEIDLNLAYGEIPPDLESRIDLDPTREREAKALSAKALVQQIEGLLDEAHCVQHTAGAMIKHLQEKPEAAAAVAFSLAELSKLVAKLSPAVLGLLKGGSPAVFSLLASPQFLIGTGLAVGVTVVMFGGWKMIKQVKEAQAAKQALAWEASPQAARPVPQRAHSMHSSQSAGYDEALVVEEELSVIESWRRGIEPFRDDESADIELITPEADRATRADERERRDEDIFDSRSHRSGRTHRTERTHKTHKTERTHKTDKTERTHKTDKTERTHRTDKTRKSDIADEALETKSHRSTRTHRTEHTDKTRKADVDDEALETKSHRSTRTHRTEHSERSARTDEMHDLIIEDSFDVASQRSAHTHRTSKTWHTAKTSKTNKTNKTERMHKTHKSRLNEEVPRSSKESVIEVPVGAASEIGHISKGKGREMLAIEDGRAQRACDDLDLVMRPRVQRRESDLLKALFKGKKDKSRSELVLA